MTGWSDRPLEERVREALRDRAAQLGRRPGVAIVSLGQLPPWVGEDCAACGIYCERYVLPPETGEKEIQELAEGLAVRADLDVVLRLPAPEGEAALRWAEELERVLSLAERRDGT